jgi:excisionase family DNA binding protein
MKMERKREWAGPLKFSRIMRPCSVHSIPNPMREPVEILTVDELAAWLKMSKRAVYELTSERGRARMKHPLPVLRINSAIRFVKSDVEEWLEKLRGRVG